MSMALSQMKLANEVGVSVMKMAMDTGESQMNDMVQMVEGNTKMMERSVNPHIGSSLDLML